MTGDTHALDDEARTDALDVLTDALQWRLTAARWAASAPRSTRWPRRCARATLRPCGRRVADLELLGPVRAVPIGREPVVPPPDPVRDEINELVGVLDDDPEQPS